VRRRCRATARLEDADAIPRPVRVDLSGLAIRWLQRLSVWLQNRRRDHSLTGSLLPIPLPRFRKTFLRRLGLLGPEQPSHGKSIHQEEDKHGDRGSGQEEAPRDLRHDSILASQVVGLQCVVSERMTRFKELRRIEAAIEHRDEAQLRWAADYCRMRIRIAPTTRAAEHWRRIEQRVKAAVGRN
jgi:hypothetical protein